MWTYTEYNIYPASPIYCTMYIPLFLENINTYITQNAFILSFGVQCRRVILAPITAHTLTFKTELAYRIICLSDLNPPTVK